MAQGLIRDADKIRKAIDGLARPLLELAEDALRLGWHLQLGNSGVLALISPGLYGDTERIIIPRNEKNVRDKVLQTWNRKIVRYAVPEKLTEADKRFLAGEVSLDLLSTPAKRPKEEEEVRVPTVSPPGRQVEEVQLPQVNSHGLPTDVRVVDKATGEEVPDPGPVNQGGSEPKWPLIRTEPLTAAEVAADDGPPFWCPKCEAPEITGWGSRYARGAHFKSHVERKDMPRRSIRCRYCEQRFSGVTAGYRRGQHELNAHKRKGDATNRERKREERNGVTAAPQEEPRVTKLMLADDALEMIVQTLAEAGVIGDDTKVAGLEEQLRMARADAEEARRERDEAREQLANIKKAFRSLGE